MTIKNNSLKFFIVIYFASQMMTFVKSWSYDI